MPEKTILNISLLKKIGWLSLPVMLSNMLQAAIAVIDTIMIGRLGPISIAAVGMGNTLRLFLLIMVLSVAGGAISLVAQAKGSRDPQRMSLIVRQSIVSGLILSILLGIIGFYLAGPLLDLMDRSGEVEAVNLGTQYLQVLFLGTPFLLLNIVTNKLMQGAGDMITPLLITISILILNVGFNYLFIFGWWVIPAYGVVGASIGTILSRALLLVFTLWLFHAQKNVIKILAGSWVPNWAVIKDILSIGVPSGIQGVFRHASNLIIIGIVTATPLGTYGAAVLAIGMQVEQLIAQPIVGMNVAATSLIGQDLGKWQTEQAYQKGNILLGMGIFIMLLLVIPVYFFAPQIIKIFDPSGHPAIMEGSLSYFKFTLLALTFSAVGIMLTGILRGAGDTKPAMYSAIINRNLIQLGISYLLAFPMGMGYEGAWMGIVGGRIMDAIVMSYFWIKKKWLKVALEKTEVYRIHLIKLSSKNVQRYLNEVRTPLMKIQGTIEQITPSKVIYQQNNIITTIQFIGEDFQFSNTSETGGLAAKKMGH